MSEETVHHNFSGWLTIENCQAVANRLNMMFGKRPFCIVVSRKCRLIPAVLVSCNAPRDDALVRDVTLAPHRGEKANLELAYGRVRNGRPTKREHCERFVLSTDVHDGDEPSARSQASYVTFLINHCIITRKVFDGSDLIEECIVIAFEHGKDS